MESWRLTPSEQYLCTLFLSAESLIWRQSKRKGVKSRALLVISTLQRKFWLPWFSMATKGCSVVLEILRFGWYWSTLDKNLDVLIVKTSKMFNKKLNNPWLQGLINFTFTSLYMIIYKFKETCKIIDYYLRPSTSLDWQSRGSISNVKILWLVSLHRLDRKKF